MKQTFTWSLLLLLALGQSAHGQEFGFGLKGGLNLASLKIDDPEASYDSRTGLHGGLFLRAKFDKIGIQPEILLSTQNLQGRYGATSVEETLTYLNIPLIFKFYPLGGLNLQLGPQLGFMLDGERLSTTGFITIQEDIKEHYKEGDVSLALGGGYDFGFGLGVDVRYNIGIKDINNAANGEETKSRVIQVSLGWNFIKN